MTKFIKSYIIYSGLALLAIALSTFASSCNNTNETKRSDELLLADSIMEEAYTYYDNANFNKSIEMGRMAADAYIAGGDSMALSDAYSHLSACYQRISMNDSALSNCYAGLRIDEKLKDKDRLSSSYNNLAAIYLGIERALEAKPFIKKAIELEQAIKPKRPNKLSIRYGIAAEIYLKLNQTDTALAFIDKSLSIDSAAADTMHMARRIAVKGDIYTAMDNKSEALENYNKAIEYLSSTPDKYSLALAYKSLGRLYDIMGNHAKSLNCLEQSTQLAKECNARKILQQNYYLMGISPANTNHNKVVEYLKMSNALKDSISNDAASDLIAHYATKLETQHKQITIEEQQHSITRQRLIIIATSVALLLLLLGCVALFLINLLRARAQRAEKNAEQMKDLFFTNMTHEFRTPLTVILGEAENLRSKDPNALNQPRYNAIINQGNQMMELVNNLLSISKVRSAIGSLEWHHGDISMMAKMIVENMRINAQDKDIEIDIESDNQDYNIDFVPEYCHSIITNLLANSLKFTNPGGKISLKMQRSASKATLTVSDNGCGIKAKDLPHIFDLFYQGDSEKASLGTGIGLAMVKQMTEAMNGKISVESQENVGTTFTVTIPVKHDNGGYPQWVPKIFSQPACSDDIASMTTTISDLSSTSTDDKPIALIVEDNNDVAMYIKHVLEEQYAVVHAANGNEGLKKAREVVPDIIITDLMMPEIDGLEMCRMVRSDELLNHIPIVIVTARSSDKDRLAALTVGADAFLVKPFNANELKALLENLLNSRMMLREKFQLELKMPNDVTAPEPVVPNASISKAVSNKNNAFMERVKTIITKNIDDTNMNSVFIADKMNLSQRQLNRKVKSVIGIDTASYIREVRISVAKDLLSTTDDPVTEISEKCGFDSSSYFSKIFKQYTKLTPTDYRKAFSI